MILKAQLLSLNKSGCDIEVRNLTSIFPKKRKATKISSDSNVNCYSFRVEVNDKLNRPNIVVNEVEIFSMNFVRHDDIYVYETEIVSAKSFMGFNLGLFEIWLKDDDSSIPLTTIVNKAGHIKDVSIQYMYEAVASSKFFSLYISRYNRANNNAQECYSVNGGHIWLNIAIANEILKEFKKFISGELYFTNRILKLKTVRKYQNGINVDNESIEWILRNPNELLRSQSGDIYHSGFYYEINNVQCVDVCEDYDTYENRLMISVLYSIKLKMLELSESFEGTTMFPHAAVHQLAEDANCGTVFMQSELNVKPPFDTVPEYSNKFLDDFRYVNLFELISRWYSENDIKYGYQIRAPILGLTKIFEHHCFILLIKSLESLGFIFDYSELKNVESVAEVRLNRGTEVVGVYYEPYIKTVTSSPLITSRAKSGGYEPDIVLSYSDGEKNIYGVIDAKFANGKIIENKLGPEIYYKYGLFLHAPDAKCLDFVLGMCPSIDGNSSFTSARGLGNVDKIKPMLGFFSVSFTKNAIEEVTEILNMCLFNK